ncbi:MAG: sortase [bacterium]|nr:sortase [bacterium]
MKVLNKIWLIALMLCFFATDSSAAGFAFTQNLTIGSRGNDVSVLQQFLITGGFLKIVAPTGYFGPLTKTALGKWQVSAGIYPPAGFFGPLSRAKINTVFQQALADTTSMQISKGSATTSIGKTFSSVGATDVAVAGKIDGKPVRLKIPILNVDTGFQYNGMKADGTMEIPDNIVDVGWFTGSPRPGEKGSSIVTGHVAQIRGGVMTKPGVFNKLSDLNIGDWIYVINDKGESTTFRVRDKRNFDPEADATDVFTSKDDGVHLNLITCEGTWNPAELSYSQRLVIFADAVK